MISLQKQRGIGVLKLIVLIAVCVFIGKFAFTVVPMYNENIYIRQGLKDLAESGRDLQDMNDSQIKLALENFYSINNVTIEPSKKYVFVRNADGVVVKIDYDTRANLFYNIDLVLHFDNHLHSAHPTLCCSPLAEPRRVDY